MPQPQLHHIPSNIGKKLTVSFYVQPVELSAALPDMPLFLTPDWYINVSLEETYMNAWSEFPDRWKRVVSGEVEG